MKVDRIKYTKKFSFFGNDEWVGMEAQLEEGEDAVSSVESLKRLVNKSSSDSDTITVDYSHPSLAQPVYDIAEEKELIEVENGIDNATTMSMLTPLKEAAAKFKLVSKYMSKLKSLQ